MDVATAIGLLLALIDRTAQIGALIAKAQSEGRDITSAELNTLVAADDAAKKELQDAIAKAKSEGR